MPLPLVGGDLGLENLRRVKMSYRPALLGGKYTIRRFISSAVATDKQGSGLGKMLLNAAEAAAWRHNCTSIRLETVEDHAALQRLYERHGYRVTGRRLHYYENGGAALCMLKQLESEDRLQQL